MTALDPDHGGEIVWQKRVGNGSTLGGVQWGVAADENNLYVAVSDPKFRPTAPGTPGAQTLVFDPSVTLLIDNKAGGGLLALKLETGEEVWRTPHPGCGDVPGCSPAQSAAVTAIPGLVFSGGLDGRLRAYSADGRQDRWDIDTKGNYQTVNGVAAKGGSIDGGGAVVVDGMVYVGSGSGFVGTTPGNVLLAYPSTGYDPNGGAIRPAAQHQRPSARKPEFASDRARYSRQRRLAEQVGAPRHGIWAHPTA